MKEGKKIVKIIRWTVFLFILIFASIICIYFLNKHLVNTNTEKFKNYINKNYELNPTKNIYYSIFDNDYILTKTSKISSETNSLIYVSYKKDGTIIGGLELYGINSYGTQGISYLKSTYKNKKFDCKIITSVGLEAKCNLLKQETDKFEKEMKDIFKKSKTNPKFIQ